MMAVTARLLLARAGAGALLRDGSCAKRSDATGAQRSHTPVPSAPLPFDMINQRVFLRLRTLAALFCIRQKINPRAFTSLRTRAGKYPGVGGTHAQPIQIEHDRRSRIRAQLKARRSTLNFRLSTSTHPMSRQLGPAFRSTTRGTRRAWTCSMAVRTRGRRRSSSSGGASKSSSSWTCRIMRVRSCCAASSR